VVGLDARDSGRWPGLTSRPRPGMILSLGLLRVKWAGQASGLVGTSFASGLATFDAPVVSAVQRPNEPTCTAASLTLLGLSFGAFDATVESPSPRSCQRAIPSVVAATSSAG
jgi:hypothetical protein